MNVLVIDVGTSGMRGSLYRENGERVFTKQVCYQPVHGENGMAEQSPKDFEDGLLLILRAFAARTELFCAPIDAIAITSQRSSIIPLDRAGKPLMNAVMWQDTRNQKFCKSLEKYNDTIRRKSGADVNCIFSGGKMGWLRQEKPELYARICKIVNIPEYLIHLMTGEFVTDYTYGSRSNLMNLRSCQWDEELLELFQVKKEHLCVLRPPGEISGYLTQSFAMRTGLRSGIPIISAGGDQQCAAMGHGAYKEGVVSIVSGTGAFLITTCSKIPENLSGNLICNCASVTGNFIIEANVLACCSAFDWFCRSFYDWDKIDYGSVNQELRNLYGTKSTCVVLPYFQGRSTPDWNAQATATFHGITLGTRREELLKALVEGIFIEIDNNIRNFSNYVQVKRASISGGLTKSRVMNQMQADIYGIPLVHMEDTESAANGAYMAAMKGLGVCMSLDESFDRVSQGTRIENYEVDGSVHKDYCALKTQLNGLYEKIYGQKGIHL